MTENERLVAAAFMAAYNLLHEAVREMDDNDIASATVACATAYSMLIRLDDRMSIPCRKEPTVLVGVGQPIRNEDAEPDD